mgnify:CR=1 FL=1
MASGSRSPPGAASMARFSPAAIRSARIQSSKVLEAQFRALGALDLYLGIFRDALRQARAIRRCGAAALDLAYTAAGVYDGFFELRLSAWDIAAGALLVEEAGGAVSDFDGGDGYLASGNVLAGGIPVHRELLALIHGHASEERVARLAR